MYAVGGCVRDEIMGLPIKDIDLAVDLPDGGVRFAWWLHEKGYTLRKLTTYPAFGTAMLHLKKFPDLELELVQTRREKYTDRFSCHPETAHGTLEEDTMRRDLTINALYYDISRQKYIDLSGKGLSDIENHIIRTPADPDITYDDDPLRILRCVRFSKRFGWKIDPATLQAMKRNVPRLQILSPKRTATEIDRIITADFARDAILMLRDMDALATMFPDLKDKLSDRTIDALVALPAEPILRLAAMMLELADNEQTPDWPDRVFRSLRRYHYDRDIIRRIIFLLRHNRKDLLSGNIDAIRHSLETYVPGRSRSRRRTNTSRAGTSRRRPSSRHAASRTGTPKKSTPKNTTSPKSGASKSPSKSPSKNSRKRPKPGRRRPRRRSSRPTQ